jgi:uronate dehydrogenase
MEKRKRFLITGAAGQIGSILAAGFRNRYDVRGFDRLPMPELPDAIVGDVADMEAVMKAAEGMDGIAHLAAGAGAASAWERVLPSNIVGMYNVLEAARLQGVKRVAFASTSQVTTGYPTDERITWDMLPRPVNYYAVSKVFGEMLGYMYSREHGVEFVSIRIGTFYRGGVIPAEHKPIGKYLSPRDAVQLFELALTRPGVEFEIVSGMSKNPRCRFDLDHAREVLGYEPVDSEEGAL